MQDCDVPKHLMPSMVDAERNSRTYQRLTWLCIVLALAGCIIGIVVPAGLGWDFANFYDAGRRVAAGQIDDLYNPFSLIRGTPPQGTTGFYGTPISALLYVTLSWFPPETALIVFKIQNVVAFFAAFLLLFVFCQRFIPDSDNERWKFAALFAFLCLIYQPFWTVFRVGGQTTPTVFLLIAIALVFHTNGQFWGSASCVVLATVIKPGLAPALLFLIFVSGRRFAIETLLVGAIVGLSSLMVMGWPAHLAFLRLAMIEARATYPWYYNSSLYVLIGNVKAAIAPEAAGGIALLFVGATYLLKAIAIATVTYLAIRSRSQIRTAPAQRHFDFMLSIMFFLLWSSTLWEHYLALLFIPLIHIVATRQHFSRHVLTLVAAIFVLAVGQNLIFTTFLRDHVAFDSLPSLLAIGLFKSGPLLLTLILLWRHHSEIFRSYGLWGRTP